MRLASTLGLPSEIRACLFDLDGVLTQTAQLHAAAWKEMFDAFLRERADATGEPSCPSMPSATTTSTSTASPATTASARSSTHAGSICRRATRRPPGTETIIGLGDRKNELVLSLIRHGGVEPYDGSVRYVRAARDAGLRRAVVSASTNCRDILARGRDRRPLRGA